MSTQPLMPAQYDEHPLTPPVLYRSLMISYSLPPDSQGNPGPVVLVMVEDLTPLSVHAIPVCANRTRILHIMFDKSVGSTLAMEALKQIAGAFRGFYNSLYTATVDIFSIVDGNRIVVPLTNPLGLPLDDPTNANLWNKLQASLASTTCVAADCTNLPKGCCCKPCAVVLLTNKVNPDLTDGPITSAGGGANCHGSPC